MTNGRKVLFGLPLLLQIAFIVPMEWILLKHTSGHGDVLRALQDIDQELLARLGAWLLISVVLTMGTMVAYMVYLMQNSSFSSTQRTTWLIVLLLTGTLGQIIFFFKFIRKAPAPQP